ncbi:hypothetical protein ASG54_05650 [Aureimonas sp. Leaf460]|uniref:hypothetical protein n=1 Tax=Aureimonas sp. Leaf460 TaxID=1736384 RepID=UPI0006F493FD|nr:hypothetical protein [Aureimonas sp. Leaf460]KQT69590.1 hypothetical protein ASG62_00125 [Aureimonas sp. Leaf427]KQT80940.1 hypothetical protein ASG54_05650 [Aureimonas sp. Leaf460]
MRLAAISLAILSLGATGPVFAQEASPSATHTSRDRLRDRDRQDLNDSILERRSSGRERDLIQLRRLQNFGNNRRNAVPPESAPANQLRRPGATVRTQ